MHLSAVVADQTRPAGEAATVAWRHCCNGRGHAVMNSAGGSYMSGIGSRTGCSTGGL